MSKRMFIGVVVATLVAGTLLALIVHPLWLAVASVFVAVEIMLAVPPREEIWTTITVPQIKLWHKLTAYSAVIVAIGIATQPAAAFILGFASILGWLAIYVIHHPKYADYFS